MKALSRKIYALVACILLCAIVAGCFVPEATAGFEGAEAMQGGGQAVSGNVASQVQAPATYFAEWSQDRFHSAADAAVEIPDVESIPYVRVGAADFTQEQVDRAVRYLLGDALLYDINKPLTLKEVEEELGYMYDALGYASTDEEQIYYEERIAELEAQLKTASETTEYQESDGKLRTDEYKVSETQTASQEALGVFAQEGDWRYELSVSNNQQIEGEVDPYDTTGVIPSIYKDASLQYEKLLMVAEDAWTYAVPMEDFEMPRDEIEREGEAIVGINVEDALDEAQSFFDAMGVEMELTGMGIESAIYDWGGEVSSQTAQTLINEPASRYRMQFVRKTEGVDALYLTGDSMISTNLANGIYFEAHWGYEMLDMRISKNGIEAIYWRSPLTIGEVIPQTQALLPFDQISEIYEGMLYLAYADRYGAPENDPNIEAITLYTDRVQLGYFRVSDENSVESGTYVPAWGFYGRIHNSYLYDGEESSYEYEASEPLLLINALDGSILDPWRGTMSALSPVEPAATEAPAAESVGEDTPIPAPEEAIEEVYDGANEMATDGDYAV